MARAVLGQQIDIHTGGVEHIPVHHNNEIAQSEAATGRVPFSRFWLHRAHVQIDGAKIAKSDGNTVYLADVLKKGHDPLALRYLFLQAHYRTPSNFTWDALGAAAQALSRLRGAYARAEREDPNASTHTDRYEREFLERINDDLDTPGALALVWNAVRDDSLSGLAKRRALEKFDKVLGLDISAGRESAISAAEIPAEILALVEKREEARLQKDWHTADTIRKEIGDAGFAVEDTPNGPRVSSI